MISPLLSYNEPVVMAQARFERRFGWLEGSYGGDAPLESLTQWADFDAASKAWALLPVRALLRFHSRERRSRYVLPSLHIVGGPRTAICSCVPRSRGAPDGVQQHPPHSEGRHRSARDPAQGTSSPSIFFLPPIDPSSSLPPPPPTLLQAVGRSPPSNVLRWSKRPRRVPQGPRVRGRTSDQVGLAVVPRACVVGGLNFLQPALFLVG